MNKKHKHDPRLPGLSTTLLIAGIFAVPVTLWGDRWPWLVAFPIAIMVILTVRSEWLRLSASNERKNVQTAEPLVVTDSIVLKEVQWTAWYPAGNWVITVPPDCWEISNVVSIDRHDIPQTAVDERLTAAA
jgi:hypothetical protein